MTDQTNDVPTIRTFQFDSDGIGLVRNSVNLYRGDVNYPLQLLSLPGRNSLDVNVSAMYGSTIEQQVLTWNLTAPTGILGLGWSMPIDGIVRDSPIDAIGVTDVLYLVMKGSPNQLIHTGASGSAQVYQLEGYQFWQILYYPSDERWEVTDENGITSVFGSVSLGNNAVQWGVSWGNWIGSSAATNGQQQYATAWNLRQMTNPWGDAINFNYSVVMQAVGTGGLTYTKASYLAGITDVYGRTVTFNYAPKIYQPGNVCEYQDPHKTTPNNNPDAYQSRYETQYLSSINVAASDGNRLFSILFEYTLFNAGGTGDPNYAFLWKRQLTSVRQENSTFDSAPPLQFTYCSTSEPNPGALETITYPTGAVATYTYQSLQITSARDLVINAPVSGATPRVWFGPEYVVVGWYTSSGLWLSVYTWSGQWTSWTAPTINTAINPASLNVFPMANAFGVAFQNSSGSQQQIWLFRQSRTAFGQWSSQQNNIGLNAGAAATQFAQGDNFLIAFNASFQGNPFRGWSWNWSSQSWVTPSLPSFSLSTPALVSLAGAGSNAYIASSYNQSSSVLTSQLLWHDDMQAWKAGSVWSNNFTIASSGSGQPLLLSWSLGATFAVATYVTSIGTTSVSYSLSVFQWNSSFNIVNPSNPVTVPLTSPASDGTIALPIFSTNVIGSLIGNTIELIRYVGTGVPAGWTLYQLQQSVPSTNNYAFAYGIDSAAISVNNSGGTTNTAAAFNPNTPNSSGWSTFGLPNTNASPTLASQFLTLGSNVWYLGASGSWSQLTTFLQGPPNNGTLQNRAPLYFAWESGSGSGTNVNVALLANGNIDSQLALTGAQRITVDSSITGSGTALAGSDAFVTYPSSSSSFNSANSLHLYRVVAQGVQGGISDTPVVAVSIEDGYSGDTPFQQSYAYNTTAVVFDAATGIAQYPVVTTVAGSSVASNGPAGSTVSYFSNGVSTAGGVFYPVGWIFNYQTILNGMLLATKEYDVNNNLVAQTVNYWSVSTTDGNGNQLYGAYFRQTNVVKTADGVTSSVQTTYDTGTGLPTTSTTTSLMGGTTPRTMVQQKTYAWQVPAYASAMLAAHDYGEVVQTVQSTDGTVTGSSVTTWQNWGSSGQSQWAPWQTFVWSGNGSGPTFDFTPGAPNPDWQQTSLVVSRQMPSGSAQETLDVMGLPTSVVYDSDGIVQVATFTGGSASNEEVAYAGFESYAPAAGWTIGGGASIVDTAAFTGTASLDVPAGVTGLTGSFNSPGTGGNALISCWVNTSSGFGGDPGTAGVVILLSYQDQQIDSVTLPIEDTGGQWAQVFGFVPIVEARAANGLPADAAITFTVSVVNSKQTASFLLDDAAVAPVVGTFNARTFDMERYIVTASSNASGGVVYNLFDGYARVIGTAGPQNCVMGVSARYSSRFGNDNVFAPDDPNAVISVRCTGPSQYQNYGSGAPWQEYWSSSNPSQWSVSGGQLLHAAGASDNLSLLAPAPFTNAAMRLQAIPQGALTAPIGLTIAGVATVQWDPTAGAWQLVTPGGGTTTSEARMRFTLPEDAAEDVERLSKGLHRTVGQTLSVGARTSGGSDRWSVFDPRRKRVWVVENAADGAAATLTATEWLLIVEGSWLFFYADGQQIFSTDLGTTISGTLQLFTSDAVAFQGICALSQPRVSASFLDACGRERQRQVLDATQAMVGQTVYDSLGNAAVQTKSAYVQPSTSQLLLAYCPSFVTSLDWNSGVMTGLVADAYPNDGGYPYTRQVYESSPLNRPIQTGLPGQQFAINLDTPNPHVATTAYGASDGSFNLPAGQYFSKTITNPQGVPSMVFTDKSGKTIGQTVQQTDVNGNYAQSFYQFDDAGNVNQIFEPNYYAPPSGEAADWVVSMTYDFYGNMLSRTTPSTGTTNFLYDSAGRLRFQQDPLAAQQGVIVYRKYDAGGRVTETGSYAAAWNPEVLEQYVDDLTWPSAPTTWQKMLFYDGDGSTPSSLGRLTTAWTNNAGTTDADVVETFTYDVFGNVLVASVQATAFDADEREVTYAYDAMSNVTSIAYPDGNEIEYTYDGVGRMITVASSGGTVYGEYTYNADGSIATETLNAGAAQPYVRTAQYMPPGWPQSLSTSFAGSSSFAENLQYTSGGYNGAGYYDGQIANTAFTYDWTNAPAGYSYAFQYDDQGQMQVAGNTPNAGWNFGTQSPLTFDANSNILTLTQNTTAYTYNYTAGNDQLQNIAGTDGSTLSFGYNADGAIDSLAGSRTLSLTYNVVTGLPMTATTPSDSLTFQYSAQQRRVLKTTSSYSKLYVRGNESRPLTEVVSSGGSTATTSYVYGPAGAIAMLSSSTASYILRDHLGSTRVVLDSAGNVLAGYDYFPFGGFARTYGDASICTYLFTGQEYDAETSLYNYNARLYDPVVGRFYAPDPSMQYFSPYVYAGNNPVMLVDPTGQLAWWEWLLIGIAAVVVVAAAVAIAVVTCGTAVPEELALGEGLADGLGGGLAVQGGEDVLGVGGGGGLVAEDAPLLGGGGQAVDYGAVGNQALDNEVDLLAANDPVEEELPDEVVRAVKPHNAGARADATRLRPVEFELRGATATRQADEGLSTFSRTAPPDVADTAPDVRTVSTSYRGGGVRSVGFRTADILNLQTDTGQPLNLQLVRTPGTVDVTREGLENLGYLNQVHYEIRLPVGVDMGGQTVVEYFNAVVAPRLPTIAYYI